MYFFAMVLPLRDGWLSVSLRAHRWRRRNRLVDAGGAGHAPAQAGYSGQNLNQINLEGRIHDQEVYL
jgi:dihydroxyacetone kinase